MEKMKAYHAVFDEDAMTFERWVFVRPACSASAFSMAALLSSTADVLTFDFERWSLTTYLDLQNATNAQNLEVINWTYDYSEEEPVAGLPLVPSFGLRGEF